MLDKSKSFWILVNYYPRNWSRRVPKKSDQAGTLIGGVQYACPYARPLKRCFKLPLHLILSYIFILLLLTLHLHYFSRQMLESTLLVIKDLLRYAQHARQLKNSFKCNHLQLFFVQSDKSSNFSKWTLIFKHGLLNPSHLLPYKLI